MKYNKLKTLNKVFFIFICVILLSTPTLLVFANIQYQKNRSESNVILDPKIKAATIELYAYDLFDIYKCTGVIISNKYPVQVLTAKHCTVSIYDGLNRNKIVSKKQKARHIIRSTSNDLALLVFDRPFKDKKAINVAKNKKIRKFQNIYHLGLPDSKFIASKGFLTFVTKGDEQLAYLHVIGGCSGGGIFNENIELIGIVTKRNDKMDKTIFENIGSIRKFLSFANYHYIRRLKQNLPILH